MNAQVKWLKGLSHLNITRGVQKFRGPIKKGKKLCDETRCECGVLVIGIFGCAFDFSFFSTMHGSRDNTRVSEAPRETGRLVLIQNSFQSQG